MQNAMVAYAQLEQWLLLGNAIGKAHILSEERAFPIYLFDYLWRLSGFVGRFLLDARKVFHRGTNDVAS